ncbi:MAG: protein kinase [Acidobacteriota bacterium]
MSTPKTLAHYELNELLGEGGMGSVYGAVDTKLGRRIAVKILREEEAALPERLDRFRREAIAAAAITHPNIITLHSVEEQDGVHFLTMELAQGEPLADAIPASGMRPLQLLHVAIQLCDALGAAHDRGVVHRDLKPANSLIDAEGAPKVLDFGIAKLSASIERDGEGTNLTTFAETRAGAVFGTLPYMSPEQILAKPVDHRTDLFSLGVVLHEMATGKRPFQGDTSAELTAAILRDAPPALTESRGDLPVEISDLIDRCLEKEPADRPQSARELRSALDDLRRRLESREYTAPEPSAPEPRKPGPPFAERVAPGAQPAVARSSSRLLWAGLAVAALAAAAWLGLRGASETTTLDSIAVLPLRLVGEVDDGDYLSSGLSEGVSNHLSALRGLRVMSQDSLRRFEGRGVDAQTIGRQLGVAAVVSGSLAARDDTLRVQMELIEVRGGAKLWGQQLTRQRAELLDLQDEITREIAEQLTPELSAQEREEISRQETTESEAYQLYLRGRHQWNQRTETGYLEAIRYFRQAIALDPGYARAYVGLADAQAFLSTAGETTAERYDRAQEISRRALELDGTLGEAHTTLALVLQNRDWNLEGAEREYRRALALSPEYGSAHHWYAELLVQRGRMDEAVAQYRRALTADPLSSAIASDLGLTLFFAGRSDEAVARLQDTARADPQFARTYEYLARVHLHSGRTAEALDALSEAARSSADRAWIDELRAAAQGEGDELPRRLLERVLEREREDDDYAVALAHARLGDVEATFEALERAVAERQFDVLFFEVTPEFERFRDDPRYASLTEALNERKTG